MASMDQGSSVIREQRTTPETGLLLLLLLFLYITCTIWLSYPRYYHTFSRYFSLFRWYKRNLASFSKDSRSVVSDASRSNNNRVRGGLIKDGQRWNRVSITFEGDYEPWPRPHKAVRRRDIVGYSQTRSQLVGLKWNPSMTVKKLLVASRYDCKQTLTPSPLSSWLRLSCLASVCSYSR